MHCDDKYHLGGSNVSFTKSDYYELFDKVPCESLEKLKTPDQLSMDLRNKIMCKILNDLNKFKKEKKGSKNVLVKFDGQEKAKLRKLVDCGKSQTVSFDEFVDELIICYDILVKLNKIDTLGAARKLLITLNKIIAFRCANYLQIPSTISKDSKVKGKYYYTDEYTDPSDQLSPKGYSGIYEFVFNYNLPFDYNHKLGDETVKDLRGEMSHALNRIITYFNKK